MMVEHKKSMLPCKEEANGSDEMTLNFGIQRGGSHHDKTLCVSSPVPCPTKSQKSVESRTNNT
jgi:hypothetical protein